MLSELEFIKRMVFREYPGKISILIVNEILASFLVLIGLGGITTILGALLNGNRQLPGVMGTLFNFLGLSEAEPLTTLLFMVGVYLIQVTLESFSKYLASSTSVHLTKGIRKKMNDALLRADWIRFSAVDQGKYMQTLVTESALAGGAVFHLSSMVASGLITVVLLLSMLILSIEAFFIFLVAGGFFLLAVEPLMARTRKAAEQSINISKEMNNVVTDTRHLFKTLLAENLVRLRVNIIDRLIDRAAFVDLRKQIYGIVNSQVLGVETVAVLLIVSIYYLVFRQGNNADLIINLLLLERIGTYFAVFQNRRHLMVSQIPSYQACLEMMKVFNIPGQDWHGKLPIQTLEKAIEVKHTSFEYSGGHRGLKNVSLSLPSSGLIFFVGKSGSGKTTLVDIITGLIRPDAGEVLVDGKALTELDRDAFAKLVTYVPQQAYLFKGSLRENLTFGSENVTNEDIWKALQAADCAQVVRSLALELDAEVAPGGSNFSGGERHRLALARALIRGGKILVLDEPAGSVDVGSEKSIFQALQKLGQNILVIVITHSQEVIQGMKNIYLIHQGQFVWQGSYNELIKSKQFVSFLNEPEPQLS